MQGKSIQGKERKRNRNAVPVSARCWIDSAASLNLALGVMLKHYSAKLSAVFCPSFGAHTWTKMFLLPVRALATILPCHFWKLSLHLRSKLPEIVREEWSRNDPNVAIKSLDAIFGPSGCSLVTLTMRQGLGHMLCEWSDPTRLVCFSACGIRQGTLPLSKLSLPFRSTCRKENSHRSACWLRADLLWCPWLTETLQPE